MSDYESYNALEEGYDREAENERIQERIKSRLANYDHSLDFYGEDRALIDERCDEIGHLPTWQSEVNDLGEEEGTFTGIFVGWKVQSKYERGAREGRPLPKGQAMGHMTACHKTLSEIENGEDIITPQQFVLPLNSEHAHEVMEKIKACTGLEQVQVDYIVTKTPLHTRYPVKVITDFVAESAESVTIDQFADNEEEMTDG